MRSIRLSGAEAENMAFDPFHTTDAYISPGAFVAYANSPRIHHAMRPALARQVVEIAHNCFPEGFYVSQDAPQTCSDIAKSFASGRFTVWSGGSDLTVWGSPFVNWCFRAWHDWCHLRVGCALTEDGEAAALRMQQAMAVAVGRGGKDLLLLEAEVLGQAAHFAKFGAFPVDQIIFADRWMNLGEQEALLIRC